MSAGVERGDRFSTRRMGRPRRDDRQMLNGILWILRSAQNGVAYAITMVVENGLLGLPTGVMTVPSSPSWRPLHLKLRQDCYVDLDT